MEKLCAETEWWLYIIKSTLVVSDLMFKNLLVVFEWKQFDLEKHILIYFL